MTTKPCFRPVFSILFIALFSVQAEDIILSGTIRNQFDKPVLGAAIKLLSDTSISTTSDSAGSFTLIGEYTALLQHKGLKLTPAITLRRSRIGILLTEPGPLTITIFTIAGKVLHTINADLLDAGLHSMTLPIDRFGAGLYLIAVDFAGAKSTFVYVSSTKNRNNSFNQSTSLKSTVNLPKRKAQATADTLFITAKEYEPALFPVASYILSGIEIVLHKNSRLDYITRSCEDVNMPGPLSGGSSGWGSRYWDCCKPSCSWPENTSHIAANCGIDGAEEIECFYQDSAGDSKWNVGTKSGCEQDGIAYMCYRHTPFAVCEKLAYGFAAVPAANSACGKCFQLDFDGGFRHGDPKPAHAMIKGKTMIVMASNIGHDVSSGQFDIMIPGGGLGAFREGCRKQWGVDVNDEDIVGVGNGGFISKCQIKLGWDADPEDLKECVRGMCDNLFGSNPAMHDLWEGCIWYVDWMHAVDNPTFTYKEVPCPEELVELYYSAKHPRP